MIGGFQFVFVVLGKTIMEQACFAKNLIPNTSMDLSPENLTGMRISILLIVEFELENVSNMIKDLFSCTGSVNLFPIHQKCDLFEEGTVYVKCFE